MDFLSYIAGCIRFRRELVVSIDEVHENAGRGRFVIGLERHVIGKTDAVMTEEYVMMLDSMVCQWLRDVVYRLMVPIPTHPPIEGHHFLCYVGVLMGPKPPQNTKDRSNDDPDVYLCQ